MLKNKLVIITLWVLFLLFSILYNILNIKSSNYPLSEWLQYNLIHLNSFYKDWETLNFPLDINDLEDKNINKDIFINWWFMLNQDNKLYPFSLAWSSYIFSPIYKILKIENMSIIIFIFWLISLIYFYLSINFLIKNIIISLIWLIFYAFIYSIFQFYLFIWDSIVSLALFISSYYYFLRFYGEKKLVFLTIWSILITTAIVIRIEYIIIFPIILILIFNSIIKNFNKKIILILWVSILIFSTFLISNYYRHGNMLSLWYEKEKTNIEYIWDVETKWKIEIVFKRFFSNFDNIDNAIERIKHNQKFFIYILNISILFIFFFILKKKEKHFIKKTILYPQIIYIIIIYIYISAMYFTDSWTSWILSVHTRYLLPIYYIIFLYSLSFWLYIFLKKYDYKLIIILLMWLLQISIFYWNFNKSMWVYDLTWRKEESKLFFNDINKLGNNDFIFTFFDRSGSKNLENPYWPTIIHIPYIIWQNISPEEIVNSIDYLLKHKYNVYIYNKEHFLYYNYGKNSLLPNVELYNTLINSYSYEQINQFIYQLKK